MKIPHEAIPDCYKYAKAAFDKKITPDEARQRIHDRLDINFGSAKDYYLYYHYLMTGTNPTWALNAFTTEYFLQGILEDHNNSMLHKKNTLFYFRKLITKLEAGNIGSKKSMWEIYEKYSKMF